MVDVYELQQVIYRKLASLTYPTCIGRLHWGNPIEGFPRSSAPGKKTRVPGLSCAIVCVILCLAVSVEHQLVTDRQTDITTAYTVLA